MLLVLLLGATTSAWAQDEKRIALIRGMLTSQATGEPANDVQVTIPYLRLLATSDGTGAFSFSQVPYGTYTMVIGGSGITTDSIRISVNKDVVDLGTINVVANDRGNVIQNALIPTLLLDENNAVADDDGISSQNVSGLLTASRDPFQNTVAFQYGPYRFQPRGYDRSAQQVFVNGAPMNDIETGDAFWSQWGGLNDVFRGRSSTYGLEPSEYAIGGINGAVFFDATAASQRKQTRITYSNSNRQYRNRLMITHNSGLLKGGWAYSVSLGKRWGKEGFVEGTFYDAYSYYAAVSKRFGLKHEINLTAFGAPTRRGKVGPSFQEVYDITGDNFYNPNWGYQNGEKRNVRVADYHQPTFILNYKYAPSRKTNWHTSIGYQYGINANSQLDWYQGRDPRPDYYRNLPSWQRELHDDNPVLAAQEANYVVEQWKNDVNVRQVNWDRLYEVNRGNFEAVNDVDGIAGNTVYGRRSVYVVGSDVDDIRKYTFNTYAQHALNDHITLYEGFTLLSQRTESYRRLDDLLGGDFYVNYNQFAEREYVANPSVRQHDLETPNRVIKEGDKYFYHYNSHFTKSWLWAQAAFTYNKVDFFISASGGFNNFRREGLYRNGLYPTNSKGEAPMQKFLTYTLKGGVTYKLNGRNYLFVNAATMQDAPSMDNTYISPRTRNQTVDNPIEENTYSIEGGYLLRAPKINGRLVGYATDVKGATIIKRFYNEGFQTFTNYAMKNVDMRFTGAEIAVDYKLTPAINVTGVAALGQAFYTNRPTVSVYGDNDTSISNVSSTVYIKDYYLAVGPQSAYSLSLKYSSRHYWFGTISFNYFDRNYVDIAPTRRTADAATASVPYGSPQWNDLFRQEQLPSFYTVDVFIYKSILLSKGLKFLPRNTYLYLSLGVNNLLDNRDIRTGGFENLRFDSGAPEKFPGKYFIGYGRNYFANISLKF